MFTFSAHHTWTKSDGGPSGAVTSSTTGITVLNKWGSRQHRQKANTSSLITDIDSWEWVSVVAIVPFFWGPPLCFCSLVGFFSRVCAALLFTILKDSCDYNVRSSFNKRHTIDAMKTFAWLEVLHWRKILWIEIISLLVLGNTSCRVRCQKVILRITGDKQTNPCSKHAGRPHEAWSH